MGKAGKWKQPSPSQYVQSKSFCRCFNLIMQNTLEVFWLFVV